MPGIRGRAITLLTLPLHVGVAAAGFGMSAMLFARGPGNASGAWLLRILAAAWLCAALWRAGGVLLQGTRLPERIDRIWGRLIGGRQGAASIRVDVAKMATFLSLVGLVGWMGGGVADARWPSAPAELRTWLAVVFVPAVLAGVLRFILKTRSRQQRETAYHVANMNEATLARLREKKAGRAPAPGAAFVQEPAPSATEGVRQDALLGSLRYSSSDGGWWATTPLASFPLLLLAGREGPSARQRQTAAGIVQQSFEVTLQASDAARPLAAARGVGLPRFTAAACQIAADEGATMTVSLHLRCDGDPDHVYVVRSIDAGRTFAAD